MPKVNVDLNRCRGKGTCIKICPAGVFELHYVRDHPETLKAIPVRADECTMCMECIPRCIERAITVEKQ
ncbi:ferredoxin family protein [Candidatus Bathyarchaeota archaeon]|nr:ferredoxin family protein [Candidatus Bathyarchaeota archaeon]